MLLACFLNTNLQNIMMIEIQTNFNSVVLVVFNKVMDDT